MPISMSFPGPPSNRSSPPSPASGSLPAPPIDRSSLRPLEGRTEPGPPGHRSACRRRAPVDESFPPPPHMMSLPPSRVDRVDASAADDDVVPGCSDNGSGTDDCCGNLSSWRPADRTSCATAVVAIDPRRSSDEASAVNNLRMISSSSAHPRTKEYPPAECGRREEIALQIASGEPTGQAGWMGQRSAGLDRRERPVGVADEAADLDDRGGAIGP